MYLPVCLLWTADHAWAETTVRDDPSALSQRSLLAQASSAAQAPEAPPQPPPPTPPPSRIPSTAPPAFPSIGGPGIQPAATFEFHPSISLSEEYTDNFNLSPRDKEENFRTVASPTLTLLINGAFTTGSIAYTLSGNYDSSTKDTALFHSLLGQVSWQASPRLKLTATDVLTRSDEPTKADQLSLRRERRPFTSNSFSLESDYLIANVATTEYYRLATFFDTGGADTTSHTLGASASTTFYETNTVTLGYEYLQSDTSARGTDITGHEVKASLARQLTSLASAGLSGSYALRTEKTPDSAGEAEFTIWSVSIFGTYSLPAIWSLTASAGVSRFENDRSETIPTATLTFSYDFLPGVTLTLQGDAGFSETFETGQNRGVVKTRGVSASLSYPISPFITGSVTGLYRRNEFTGVAGGPERGTTEDTRGGLISLSIQLLRWLTMALEYAYTNATSSTGESDFIENRARASLNATF